MDNVYIPAGKVQEFDVGFSTTSSLLSTLIKGDLTARIRMVIGSEWSHVIMAVRYHEQLMWAEACGDGVVYSPLSKYCSPVVTQEAGITAVALKRLANPISAYNKLAIRYRVNQLIGCKYDKLGLLGFAITVWLKLKKLFIRTPDRWVCSSFVAEAFKSGGVLLYPRQSILSTTPEHLWQSKLLELVD